MRTLLLSGALLLALAAPASAAEVARVDGATLSARDGSDGELCVALRTGPSGGSSRACGFAPARPYSTIAMTSTDGGRLFVGGAAPAGVARIEAELDDGSRASGATAAGEKYRGRHAGKLRFFLLPAPASGRNVALVREFDAAGALVGAVQAERRDDLYAVPPRTLLRQRKRGRSIRITGYAERAFAPTPIALDRFETRPCLGVFGNGPDGGHAGGACADLGPYQPVLDLSVEPGCGALRSVLYGFVGPGVTGVRLKLGSGRTRTLPARELAAFPGRRYVAAVLPRGEAVRDATARGAEGRQTLAEAPGGLPCVRRGGGLLYATGPDTGGPTRSPGPGDQIALESGGHRLVVRDAEADRLCAGVDTLSALGLDCVLPSPNPDFAFPVRNGRTFGYVLPADVARVRLPGGRELPTQAGTYTGPYSGTLRFVLGEAPATSGLVRFLAADGAVIGRSFITAEFKRGATRTVARGHGWRLKATRFGGDTCLGFGAECLLTGGTTAVVTARCSPRRALLHGALGRGVQRVSAELRGGARLRATVVRVPRRFGGGRVYVMPLPRRAEVVALRLDARRIRFPVLPAGRQCGYRLDEPFL